MKLTYEHRVLYLLNKDILDCIYVYTTIYEEKIQPSYEMHAHIYDRGYEYYEFFSYSEISDKTCAIIDTNIQYDTKRGSNISFLITLKEAFDKVKKK